MKRKKSTSLGGRRSTTTDQGTGIRDQGSGIRVKYKYTKYVPNLLDELDMDELMSKLSDLLMSSGFGNPRDTGDDSDRTMQALHDAILEALFNGGVLPDDLLEQLFGDSQEGNEES